MSVVDEARKAVELKSIKSPKSLPVVDIEVEDFVTWEGEDALRVTVTLSDQTDVENVPGSDVSDLKESIRDRIRARGIDRFPYVFLRTETERREMAEVN